MPSDADCLTAIKQSVCPDLCSNGRQPVVKQSVYPDLCSNGRQPVSMYRFRHCPGTGLSRFSPLLPFVEELDHVTVRVGDKEKSPLLPVRRATQNRHLLLSEIVGHLVHLFRTVEIETDMIDPKISRVGIITGLRLNDHKRILFTDPVDRHALTHFPDLLKTEYITVKLLSPCDFIDTDGDVVDT